jgi:hypothetical protein
VRKRRSNRESDITKRSKGRQVFEFLAGDYDTRSRTRARCDELERRGFAGSVIAASFLHKLIKLPGLDVGLQLAVPCRPVELQKPGTELRELLGRKRLDLPFDVLDRCVAFARGI